MRDKLIEILAANASADSVEWLNDAIAKGEADFEKRPFYYAFSGVSRHFHKQAAITASEDQLHELSELVEGFTVRGWDEFRLARVILLLHLADQDREIFLETMAAVLNTADLREQAAIFSAYPLMPCQEELVESAIDGLRTNIVDIYDAIALNNPFPAKHFSEEAWNQMVLKALFIHRPVYRIEGLAKRANPALSEALTDLAHERWAAGRVISPEAWRCIASHPTESTRGDLKRLKEEGDENDQLALSLIAAQSPDLISFEDIPERPADLTWDSLGQSLENPELELNGSPSRT